MRTRRSGDSHCGSRANVGGRRQTGWVSRTPHRTWLEILMLRFRSCFRIPLQTPSAIAKSAAWGPPATRFSRYVRSACHEVSWDWTASVSARGCLILVPNWPQALRRRTMAHARGLVSAALRQEPLLALARSSLRTRTWCRVPYMLPPLSRGSRPGVPPGPPNACGALEYK